MRPQVIAWGAIASWLTSAAAAQPLTCDTFRDRLNGSLIVTDGGAPEAPVFRETRTGTDGSTRLAWHTSNLDGTMTCGPAREFREFYVTLAVASRERFVEQLKRFVALNGAAICATSEATPPACADAGKQLLQTALQQMGSAFQKKVSAPSGIATRAFQTNLRADLTAAPTLITFSLDVGAGSAIEAMRQPLATTPSQSPGR